MYVRIGNMLSVFSPRLLRAVSTTQTYTRYTTDNMHKSHRSNAADHTPCVCGTSICAVLLWLCLSEPAVRIPPSASIFSHVCTQAEVYPSTYFCVVARSTDHRPDNNSNSAQSMFTSSFLQHHNPAAQQQQQWAHLARMDDRTVATRYQG